MKHSLPLPEFAFTAEAFNLAIEHTEDGERLQREIDQKNAERAAAEKQQLKLIQEPRNDR